MRCRLASLGWLAVAVALMPACSDDPDSVSRRQDQCQAPALHLAPGMAAPRSASALPARARPLAGCAAALLVACERYVFSPLLGKDAVDVIELCGHPGDPESCVPVESREFATGALLASEPRERFQPGGSLNYSEYHCQVYDGTGSLLFKGMGDDMGSAWDSILAYCASSGVRE